MARHLFTTLAIGYGLAAAAGILASSAGTPAWAAVALAWLGAPLAVLGTASLMPDREEPEAADTAPGAGEAELRAWDEDLARDLAEAASRVEERRDAG